MPFIVLKDTHRMSFIVLKLKDTHRMSFIVLKLKDTHRMPFGAGIAVGREERASSSWGRRG